MKNPLLSIAVSLTAILLLTGCGGTGTETGASPQQATNTIAAEANETEEGSPAAETPDTGASETGTSDAASSVTAS